MTYEYGAPEFITAHDLVQLRLDAIRWRVLSRLLAERGFSEITPECIVSWLEDSDSGARLDPAVEDSVGRQEGVKERTNSGRSWYEATPVELADLLTDVLEVDQ